jgi:hypothetical protein
MMARMRRTKKTSQDAPYASYDKETACSVEHAVFVF